MNITDNPRLNRDAEKLKQEALWNFNYPIGSDNLPRLLQQALAVALRHPDIVSWKLKALTVVGGTLDLILTNKENTRTLVLTPSNPGNLPSIVDAVNIYEFENNGVSWDLTKRYAVSPDEVTGAVSGWIEQND